MSIYSGFYLVLGIALVIALAFWPARIAKTKGYSWLGFFIFSLIPFMFFPSVIVAYALKDKRATEATNNLI